MNTTSSGNGSKADLSFGHSLVDISVPVFHATLLADGSPRRRGWHNIEPSHSEVDEWRPGMALCAHTGVKFDVLDVDPRHGGDVSYRRLRKELGGDPEMYAKVRTRSGGLHLYIPPLGMGTHHPASPAWPGIDLQGAGAMVFIPPTVRLGRPYELRGSILGEIEEASRQDALAELLDAGAANAAGSGGRRSTDELMAACLAAPDGGQREALLKLVQEWEMEGESRSNITLMLHGFLPTLQNFPSKKYGPWYPARGADPDKWIKTLFSRPGRIIPDARPGELDGLDEPRKSGLVRPFSTIEEGITEWLWELFLARGEISLIDGEKGTGKSATWFDVAARGSRGAAMPAAEEAMCGPFNTLVLSPENRVRQVIKPRLRAAGADMDRIFTPEIRLRRGQVKAAGMYLLPDSAGLLGDMIREADARLLIIDPIAAFLMPHINSHNDASVRTALAPLARVLADLDCAAGFSRNMNKSTSQDARDRGSGSRAFADLARVHLLCQRLPESWTGEGTFGLRFGDSNMTARDERTLVFDIVDSDVPLDDRGRMVSRVEWYGMRSVPPPSHTRGPEPMRRIEVEGELRRMFEEHDTWRAKDITTRLRQGFEGDIEGVPNPKTIYAAAKECGIRKYQGADGWWWTVKPEKPRRSG